MNEYIKFYLFDYYEDEEQVGAFDTIDAATEKARNYDAETDGECRLYLKGLTATGDLVDIDEWRY